VSAAIAGGWPRDILRRWLEGEFEMVVSYDLLLELETVLLRDKFRQRLTISDVLAYVGFLGERATLVQSGGPRRPPEAVSAAVPDVEDEYLVRLAEDARADRIVSGDKDFRGLPQADTPKQFVEILVKVQIEGLTTRIPDYYRAYFTELRSQLDRPEMFSEGVEGWMRGYKRVVTVAGRDGVVVAHFPIDIPLSIDRDDGTNLLHYPSQANASQDAFEFLQFPSESVSVLANFIGGGTDVEIGIEPDVPWGAKGFARPQQRVDMAAVQVDWEAPWTRLVTVDLNSLAYFSDPERARAEAREDVEPYLRQG
jgi:putative PIN family toxin of toxin-antitoxin system